MTTKEKREAFNNKINNSPYLFALVQMLEEELEHINSIDINIMPPPDEHQNQEKKFDQIYKTIELSGFKQLWKEADHEQLRMLKRKNILTGQEKLLLRIAELIRLCENNVIKIQNKITPIDELRKFVTIKHKGFGSN